MVDLHCHVLPGVDDGAENIEESLIMLRKAAATGVKIVVATPHLIRGSYDIGFREREQMIAELQKAANESGIRIQILPGYECYLLPELLEDKDRLKQLTVNNNGRYILVELPMQNVPPYVEEVLFNLNMEGITPVLAHPERNMEIYRKPDILFDLAMKGCIIQLNAGSLLGYFGGQIKRAARSLLTHNLVHVVASDMHSASSPTMSQALPSVESLISPERAENIFVKFPYQILSGEPLSYTESPKRFESKQRGLKSVIFRRKI